MVQSFLNVLSFWPYLVLVMMVGASLWAIWVIRQLSAKKQFSNYYKHHSGQVFRKFA